jgi:hypothetical protein
MDLLFKGGNPSASVFLAVVDPRQKGLEVAKECAPCANGLAGSAKPGRSLGSSSSCWGESHGTDQVLHTLNQAKAGFLEKIVPFFRSTLALTRRHAMGQPKC